MSTHCKDAVGPNITISPQSFLEKAKYASHLGFLAALFHRTTSTWAICAKGVCTLFRAMGLVRITSWYLNINGSHFGLPPSEMHSLSGPEWLGCDPKWCELWRIRTGPMEVLAANSHNSHHYGIDCVFLWVVQTHQRLAGPSWHSGAFTGVPALHRQT